METNEKYPGCRPGWKPDEYAANRENDPWSIEDQVKSEQAHWKLEQDADDADTAPEHEVEDHDL